jgi:hypothetical protein
MQCLAKELKDAGYRGYEIITLRKMRDTAFTADSRLSGVAFWVHEAAGKPDVLVRAQGQAKQERVKLTVAYVKGFKARERRERDARDREQNEKLKDRQRPDLKTHRGPWLQARR